MFLELKDITKTYGKTIANNHISFGMNKGEILAVIGENGAGKTTVMKILYGLGHADSGEIFLDGKKVSIHSVQDAIACGIGMVQQRKISCMEKSRRKTCFLTEKKRVRSLKT